MKNDTPRTDAVLNTYNGKASKLAADLATHAEELERELTAATKERDEARETIATMEIRHAAVMRHTQSIVDDANQCRDQRDEWRNEHDRVVREYQHRFTALATAALEASNYPESESLTPNQP